MLQLDVQFLTLVASVIIPGLVGLLAKWNAKRWFKALLNGLLSFAAAAAAIALTAEGNVVIGDWLFQALITYGTSELAYQRLYKPTGTAEFIKQRAPGGIGPEEDKQVVEDRVIDPPAAPVQPEPVPVPAPEAGLVLPGVTRPAQEETVRLTPIPPTAPEPPVTAVVKKAPPKKAAAKKTPAKKAPAKKRAPRD